MPVEVRDYDEAWPAAAELACKELQAAMPGLFVDMEHIGSTSVPGLAARPVIDLMAAVRDLDVVLAQQPTLARLRPGHVRRER